jgi:hypothetical protein
VLQEVLEEIEIIEKRYKLAKLTQLSIRTNYLTTNPAKRLCLKPPQL